MTLLAEALVVAGKCQAQFVCITLVGVLAAKRGILDDRGLSVCSKVYLQLMLPCLVLGLGTSFTGERLREWSPVMIVALAHMAMASVRAFRYHTRSQYVWAMER